MVEAPLTKSNRLALELPEGLVVDAHWLTEHGYPSPLRSYYVSKGILEQPVKRLYRRPYGHLSWEQVVVSLQTILGYPSIIGGRTALELQGFAHYLSAQLRDVHIYSKRSMPSWLFELRIGVQFHQHNVERLFRNQPIHHGPANLAHDLNTDQAQSEDAIHGSVRQFPWGHWEWPLRISTPERALLEMIDELPKRETFHQVDVIVGGMPTLSPRRMAKLLHDCKSVKVKRLFFFFAYRHKHRWLNQLDPKDFDLGTGKRVLVEGGKLDSQFQITVPEDLDDGA